MKSYSNNNNSTILVLLIKYLNNQNSIPKKRFLELTKYMQNRYGTVCLAAILTFYVLYMIDLM